jgi:hypothetical protein
VLLKENVSCVSHLCTSAEFIDTAILSIKLKRVHFRICVSGKVTALSSPDEDDRRSDSE